MKYKKIALAALLIFLLVGIVFLIYVFLPRNSKLVSGNQSQEIINILKKNRDIANYMQKNPDFAIVDKEILTKEVILVGQQAQGVQSIYRGLVPVDKRYTKVQLGSKSATGGFIAVIDLNNKFVVKDYTTFGSAPK